MQGNLSDPSFQINRDYLFPNYTPHSSNLTNLETVYLAIWQLEYSARDLYGPAIGGWPATDSLSPAFWHKVTEAFAVNDTLFQEFNALKTSLDEVVPCDAACKATTICNLRALRAENNCVS